MDPLSLASKTFREQIARIWEASATGPETSVVRLAFSRSDHKEVLKSLRLMEWDAANRRPFVVVEQAFGSPAEFSRQIASKTAHDYAELRKGLAEEGVEIKELPVATGTPTPRSVARTLVSASKSVMGPLDGLVVALVPERVLDERLYAKLVADLAADLARSEVRLLVADAPGLETVALSVVPFALDEQALRDYLKRLGQQTSSGPPSNTPRLSPAEKAALEAKLGKPIASAITGSDLRGYLLDAAAAMHEQNWKLAVRKFRAARMLCHTSGLSDEEALVSIALGSAVFAAGDRRGAIAAYKRGQEIAVVRDNPTLAAQAEFGVAAVYFAGGQYAEARASYRRVATVAGHLPPLVIDAVRMEAECFLAEGRLDDAERSFCETLAIAEALTPEDRGGTSFAFAGRALAELLQTRGRTQDAAGTLTRVERLAVII